MLGAQARAPNRTELNQALPATLQLSESWQTGSEQQARASQAENSLCSRDLQHESQSVNCSSHIALCRVTGCARNPSARPEPFPGKLECV